MLFNLMNLLNFLAINATDYEGSFSYVVETYVP